MSGWALGLVLAVVLVAGWVAGIVSTFVYGRRLMKRKLNELPGQLLDPSIVTGHVAPPPPRPKERWEVEGEGPFPGANP